MGTFQFKYRYKSDGNFVEYTGMHFILQLNIVDMSKEAGPNNPNCILVFYKIRKVVRKFIIFSLQTKGHQSND